MKPRSPSSSVRTRPTKGVPPIKKLNTTLRRETGLRIDAQIEQQLRRQILSGKLMPGDRLPPTPTLAKELRVSCTALQQAMARLAAAGLIVRRPRQGTFVTSATDKAVIAVLFGPNLTDESAYFYRAVLQAIRQQANTYHWTCRSYDGLTGSKGLPLPATAEVNQHLAADLRNHAFKGLIQFAPGVRGLGDWERTVNLPRVVYESPPARTDVELDLTQFTADSIAHLAKRGCRQITYLRASWHLSSRSADLTGLFDAAAALHLPQPQVESFLLTGSGGDMEREIFAKAQQLFRHWQTGAIPRPDGMIVGDDITMRVVALALIHAGIKVPDELPVVTLANDGVDLHYGIPVTRYEFSVKDIAEQLLKLLWKRMSDTPLPQLPVMIRGRIQVSREH
ncbi:MAG: GntR family transcriptional regulator [Verrucomicrobiota bacterium]|jgi:DNA-binding LacI/PurR family transcriptional regulator